MIFESREKAVVEAGKVVPFIFCICQSILALDNEDSEEEMLQDVGEGLNVSIDCD